MILLLLLWPLGSLLGTLVLALSCARISTLVFLILLRCPRISTLIVVPVAPDLYFDPLIVLLLASDLYFDPVVACVAPRIFTRLFGACFVVRSDFFFGLSAPSALPWDLYFDRCAARLGSLL